MRWLSWGLGGAAAGAAVSQIWTGWWGHGFTLGMFLAWIGLAGLWMELAHQESRRADLWRSLAFRAAQARNLVPWEAVQRQETKGVGRYGPRH